MRPTLIALMVGSLALAVAPSGPVAMPPTQATAGGDTAVPPRPFMRSHGEKILAARIGFCPKSSEPCAMPDVFKFTPPLPVHANGHVFVNTRAKAAKVVVDLHCGPSERAWKRGPRNWMFHVTKRQATQDNCQGGSLTVKYAKRTNFAGGTGVYTFNTEPHEH
jgi:hypothetical protein